MLSRTIWQCHWLQALELGLDPLAAPAHAAVDLHVDLPAPGLLRWTARSCTCASARRCARMCRSCRFRRT
jgi:hypothetical protein